MCDLYVCCGSCVADVCDMVHVWPMCVMWSTYGRCVWCGPCVVDMCDVVYVRPLYMMFDMNTLNENVFDIETFYVSF